MLNNQFTKFRKFIHYITLYGLKLTIIKVFSKINFKFKINLLTRPFSYYLDYSKKINIGIIGCGNHSFSSIVFYLSQSRKVNLYWCYDIDKKRSHKIAFSYNFKKIICDLNSNDSKKYFLNTDIIYIASNHSSHIHYLKFFEKLKSKIYVEKPIVTNWDDYNVLKKLNIQDRLFTGFNRPNSRFINIVFNKINQLKYTNNLNLSFFIIGHKIDSSHWYREKNEGTRICGNLSHWIDLSLLFLQNNKSKFNFLDINIVYSNNKFSDENIIINFISSNNDLINIFFSVKDDPFEGVTELIKFHRDDLNITIDNFKYMKINENNNIYKYRNFYKDVGHRNTVWKPFIKIKINDNWEHVLLSTKLILFIADMIKNNENNKRFFIEK